jgi:hypothetical protein
MEYAYKRNFISIAMAALILASLCAVCASTSVSAAPVSSANGQAALVANGIGVAGAPAVCSQDTNGVDLFVKGTDNALWWKHWDGTKWSASTSLGGYLTSDPAAVSNGVGMIDVFVRGGDGALWEIATGNRGTNWQPWYKIGGRLLEGTGPAAYNWGGDKYAYGWFVTGTDHALWHMWRDNSGYYGWYSLGGYLTSSPAAASSTFGKIDVFVRGGDSALWSRHYASANPYSVVAWDPWTSLGGRIAPGTAPATCNGLLGPEVFVVGTDNALWHKSYQTNQWSGWEPLGGYLTSSPGAVTLSLGRIAVFVRGGDNALWQKFYNGGWRDWTSAGGL